MSLTSTEQPLTADEAHAPIQTPVAPGQSVLDYLHQRQAELATEERPPLTLEVPEWAGALAVQFRYPEHGATQILAAAMQIDPRKPEKTLPAACGVIRGACWDVVGKRPGDTDWRPLDPSGQRTTISMRLAEMLGWEIPGDVKRRGDFIVRLLWSPKAPRTGRYEGDLALAGAAGEVSEYLRGVQADIEDQLEGE